MSVIVNCLWQLTAQSVFVGEVSVETKFTVLVQQKSETLALIKNYPNETVRFLKKTSLAVTTVFPAFLFF